jgi:hypothetical protein
MMPDENYPLSPKKGASGLRLLVAWLAIALMALVLWAILTEGKFIWTARSGQVVFQFSRSENPGAYWTFTSLYAMLLLAAAYGVVRMSSAGKSRE